MNLCLCFSGKYGFGRLCICSLVASLQVLMKSKLLSKVLLGLTLAFLVFNACKKEADPSPANKGNTPQNSYTPPAITFSATVQGFVVGEDGIGISGAEVKTGSKTATTDKSGYFKIDAAPFTGDFCYIKATKKGYFIGSTTIHSKATSEVTAELVMVAQNNTYSFAAAQGHTITLAGNAKVELPANSYITAAGTPYTGEVKVAALHLNPSASNFSRTIPGGDLRAYTADGQNMQLLSFGMLNVEMTDAAGNPLQLAKGSKATLTLPVPADMQAKATATMPLWYFDEDKGIWIEEGSATLQGNAYVGTVSHFTFWNVDKPFAPAIVSGKVEDSNGDPVDWAKVKIGQVVVFTNDKGEFQYLSTGNETIIVDVIDWETGLPFGINQTVNVPSAGKTINIGNLILPAQAKIKIKATVKDCNGNLLNGFADIKKGSFTGRTFVKNGSFKYYMSPTGGNADITIFNTGATEYYTTNVALPTNASNPVINLGPLVVCSKIDNTNYFKFTYTLPGQQPVTIVRNFPVLAECSYSTSNGSTDLMVADAVLESQRTYTFWTGFRGKTTGDFFMTHNQSGTPGGVLGYIQYDDTLQVISDSTILKITSYGAIGGYITGTFSGYARVLNRFNDDYFTHPKAIITNGEFKLKRLPDR